MEFAPGAIQLDDIIGGTLLAGEVPNARLETELTALADALTAGGKVPHANLTDYLATLAAALTAGGKVPHANLTDYLAQLAADLHGGGKIPWDKTMRVDASYQNAGAIVLPTGGILITSVNCGTVYTGERFLVCGMAITTKGAGASGDIGIHVQKQAGTATINFFNAYHQVAHLCPDVSVGHPVYLNCVGTGEVSVGGTLTLGLHGLSHNGDSTVGAGGGQIAVWIISQS